MALQKMFSDVALRYDRLNRLISLGMDEGWRRTAALECDSGNPEIIVDIGTGTGDLAFQIENQSKRKTKIIAVDFSVPMLKGAFEKRKVRSSTIQLVAADAVKIPFKSGSVDCVTTSFSFRNLTYKNPNREKYLKEILRVLKPRGKFVIVESSQPSSKFLKKLFQIYSSKFVPVLGGFISGQKGAYRYLGVSMANYYEPEEVSEMLKQTGFNDIKFEPLSLGLAGIHIARK
jgi:demethylmenaquinone methyltransferase/2-methoxy-6-polyprenyl-1,4-benzoquinol methylase